MTTPTANEANTEATTYNEADITAATNTFINDATTLINNAIALGQYSIFINAFYPTDLNQITTYFQNLGYSIFIPQLQNSQPVDDFGYLWTQYWEVNVTPPSAVVLLPNRYMQVEISWQTPNP